MHITTSVLDAWTDRIHPHPLPIGVHLIRLEEGDVLSHNPNPRVDNSIVGPAIVEMCIYRDGGWSAREMKYETPESIALAASLAVRGEKP